MAADGDGRFHFVLVHGASHGGWCWYKLTNLLEAEGHKVTTLDLTACGISTTPFYDVLNFSQYNYPLTDLMDSIPSTQKVVLVGHSLGGLNITDAVYKYPEKILVAIYIAAVMKKEGKSSPGLGTINKELAVKTLFGIHMDSSLWEFQSGPGNDFAHGGIIMKPECQPNSYYNMCSVEVCKLASTLLRPSPLLPLANVPLKPTPGGLSVPRVFIRTLKDKLMSQESQESMIRQWPPNKVYGIESDHCAFLSNPFDLARILLDAATTSDESRKLLGWGQNFAHFIL